ncbi:hypothetical protein KAR91_54310 [Candidatus Pacearchaeota archaeon]|nr:hypothetical protein [Candidatus Pacearchaeota archaeon]
MAAFNRLTVFVSEVVDAVSLILNTISSASNPFDSPSPKITFEKPPNELEIMAAVSSLRVISFFSSAFILNPRCSQLFALIIKSSLSLMGAFNLSSS